MTAPVRFIILILVLVVAASALMAPRLDEWLAMMRDDNRQAEIIALLEPRLAFNKDDPGLLAALGRSYAEIGNNPRAIEFLERYLAVRPDDGEAYGRLADLSRAVGNSAGRIAMLKRSIALAPQLSRVAELAGIHREEGQADDELALLSRFETELTIENGLLLRLAKLYAGNGQQDRAIRVLMRPEVLSASTRQIRNEEERLFLASLLVQTGRSKEAVRFGKQWILQWREPWLDNRLLGVVVPSAPVVDTTELAEAVVLLHPEIRLFLVHDLTQHGAPLVARHLLETWSTANPSPSMNEIAGFLSACREQDAPEIVWQAFSAALRPQASTELITRYSKAIAAEFGIGALAPFWPVLQQTVTQRSPLLAARLVFYENNPAMAKWLLTRVDVAALDVADRQVWLDLLIAVASPAEVFEVLRDLRRGKNFPVDFLTQYARLAAAFGQDTEYRTSLAELRRNAE